MNDDPTPGGEPQATRIVLDLCGLRCPLPALRTRKALAALPVGMTLDVRCTDPLAAIDIPHLVRQTGDDLVDATRTGAVLPFSIRRRPRNQVSGSDASTQSGRPLPCETISLRRRRRSQGAVNRRLCPGSGEFGRSVGLHAGRLPPLQSEHPGRGRDRGLPQGKHTPVERWMQGCLLEPDRDQEESRAAERRLMDGAAPSFSSRRDPTGSRRPRRAGRDIPRPASDGGRHPRSASSRRASRRDRPASRRSDIGG